VADVHGYAASYLVCAGIQVAALPLVALARRQNAPSDPIDDGRPADTSSASAGARSR
jgi:hypothetical protein